MKQSKSLIFASVFTLLLVLACAPGEEEEGMEEGMEDTGYEEVEEPEEMTEDEGGEATATLTTADGTEVGTVTFTESGMGGAVQISAELHDVETDGMHGFHLHENGECSAPTFESAGAHFNPENVDHACPPTTPRHAGDFGNVEITGGSGTLALDSDLLSLGAGANSVVGRAVILHGGQDDCTSQPAGNAGDRYACGVVEMDGMGMEDMGMEEEGMEGEGMDGEDMEEEGGMGES